MSLWIEQTRDTATFVEHEPHSRYIFFLREALLAKTTATIRPYSTVRDSSVITSATVERIFAGIRDTAKVLDNAVAVISTKADVSTTGFLSSRFVLGMTALEDLRDTLRVLDAVFQQVSTTLRDVVLVSGTGIASVTLRADLRTVAKLLDSAYAPLTATLRATALITGRPVASLSTVLVTRDTALLSSTFVDRLVQDNLLRDTAKILSRASVILNTTLNVREVFYGSGRAVPPLYGRAYTCSIISWGMSMFENYPFLTMTSKYVADKSNLWLRGGDTDAGALITSSLTTGELDFGSAQLKRLTGVYAAGSADAPITVAVAGDVAGSKAIFTYPMELRDLSGYRNNRAVVGKGFRSRYVQVSFRATDVRYRLITASVDMSVTERRI